MKAKATFVDWSNPQKEVYPPQEFTGRTRLSCAGKANELAKKLRCMVGSIKFSS